LDKLLYDAKNIPFWSLGLKVLKKIIATLNAWAGRHSEQPGLIWWRHYLTLVLTIAKCLNLAILNLFRTGRLAIDISSETITNAYIVDLNAINICFFLSPHRRSVCVRVTCFGSEGIGYICHHDTIDVFLKKLAHTQRALAWFQIEHFGSYRLLILCWVLSSAWCL
jgi:hypothetical protein